MAARLRFPPAFRMRSSRDFSRVYRTGSRARGALLLVVGSPNGLGHPRLGLSVSKKVWKHAVRRNRVRRVFREAFRLAAADLPALDLVLIPAEPRLEPTTPETVCELRRLVAKVVRRLESSGKDAGSRAARGGTGRTGSRATDSRIEGESRCQP